MWPYKDFSMAKTEHLDGQAADRQRIAPDASSPAAPSPAPSSPPSDTPLLDAKQRNEVYEAAKRVDYQIPQLQEMGSSELLALATDLGIQEAQGKSRKELIFDILRVKVTSRGLGWGEGVLDILPDGFGFLRCAQHNYQAGPDDIYVSPSQIRRLNLQQGHQLAGPVRPPKEGEKYFALLHVEAVNSRPVEGMGPRVPFADLTPLLPDTRLHLEHGSGELDLRLVDLFAPIGKGQRTLVLAPPHCGRTALLVHMAQSILRNDPESYVILLLLDERPEEVTEAERATRPASARREVIASTFDEPASAHISLAEMAIEKARRMVESGMDVVLLVDSLTALTRAYNTEEPHSGKILAAGLDAVALQEPKKLFGAARRLEEGGSLTVIATVLTDTGSRMNDVIAEEFQGKANCEIVLDRQLAEMHLFPAINLHRTGTRREDNLLPTEDLAKLRKLRRSLAQIEVQSALEQMLASLEATSTNADFLKTLE